MEAGSRKYFQEKKTEEKVLNIELVAFPLCFQLFFVFVCLFFFISFSIISLFSTLSHFFPRFSLFLSLSFSLPLHEKELPIQRMTAKICIVPKLRGEVHPLPPLFLSFPIPLLFCNITHTPFVCLSLSLSPPFLFEVLSLV